MFLRFLAIVLLALALGPSVPARADDFAAQFVATDPPSPVPALHFEDDKGRPFSVSDFKGRYLLLNLWATWCQPCAHEMPTLEALRNQFHGKSLEVVALAEDHDGLAAAQSFYQRHNLQDMPIYVDTGGQAPSLLHMRGLPTTILIDPNGMDIGHVEGEADWSAPDTVAFLKSKMKF